MFFPDFYSQSLHTDSKSMALDGKTTSGTVLNEVVCKEMSFNTGDDWIPVMLIGQHFKSAAER